jgi:hypothetical protein
MTLTVLDRAPVTGDAGRVTGEQERLDPEVPEQARRRTFTAHSHVRAAGQLAADRATKQDAIGAQPAQKEARHER